ncbi:MAG: BrnT family toxin [Planctomycetes bacterium]|nr:BrnT family toxin [Planctomycetota bacterium]
MERGWRVREFDWDEANEEHIARHGITPQEAEEVFRGRVLLRRARSGRYYASGQSGRGRYLALIVERRADRVVRVITARDMDDQERRFYRRWRK